MAKSRQFVQADLREAGSAVGAMKGMAATVRTDRYLGDVVKYAHTQLSGDFDDHMDLLYAAFPERYHHVYEWRTDPTDIKNPVERLWKHTLVGGGANRTASWEWRASAQPILTPRERAMNAGDPMSELPEEEIDKWSDRAYFFFWKAPVMEVNRPVHISARNVKMLAWAEDGGVRFARDRNVFEPGGGQTTMAFSMAWTQWWATEAPARFDETVGRVVAGDIDNAVNDTIRAGQRMRTKSLSLNAVADYEKAMDAAENWIENQLYKTSSTYRRRMAR